MNLIVKLGFLLFVLVITSANIIAQSKHLVIGLNSSLTSRILKLDEDVSKVEAQAIRKLEVPRQSIGIYIGTNLGNKTWIPEMGLIHRWMRFGSKIYVIPQGTVNITPQYSQTKETVVQNQLGCYLKYSSTINNTFSKFMIFIETDFVLNYGDYFIRKVTPYSLKDLSVGIYENIMCMEDRYLDICHTT